MNPSTRRGLWFTLLLLCAATVQSAWANSLTIRGAHPDFILTTAILCTLFCDANEGAAIGFSAGLLSACLASPPEGGFGSLVVSRTLVGFGVGWLEERIYRESVLIAAALVIGGSVLAEGIFFVCDPRSLLLHLLLWARIAGLGVLYNGILALPLYWIVKRCAGRKSSKSASV